MSSTWKVKLQTVLWNTWWKKVKFKLSAEKEDKNQRMAVQQINELMYCNFAILAKQQPLAISACKFTIRKASLKPIYK